MAIAVECPTCKAVAQVPDEAAGARGKCRSCGGIVQVPSKEKRACSACGTDVSGAKRGKDGAGNYYCEACWNARATDLKAVDAKIDQLRAAITNVETVQRRASRIILLFWTPLVLTSLPLYLYASRAVAATPAHGGNPADHSDSLDHILIGTVLFIATACVSYLIPLVAMMVLCPAFRRPVRRLTRHMQRFVDLKEGYDAAKARVALAAANSDHSPLSPTNLARLEHGGKVRITSLVVTGLGFLLLPAACAVAVLRLPSAALPFAIHGGFLGMEAVISFVGFMPLVMALIVSYPVSVLYLRRWNEIAAPVFAVSILLACGIFARFEYWEYHDQSIADAQAAEATVAARLDAERKQFAAAAQSFVVAQQKQLREFEYDEANRLVKELPQKLQVAWDAVRATKPDLADLMKPERLTDNSKLARSRERLADGRAGYENLEKTVIAALDEFPAQVNGSLLSADGKAAVLAGFDGRKRTVLEDLHRLVGLQQSVLDDFDEMLKFIDNHQAHVHLQDDHLLFDSAEDLKTWHDLNQRVVGKLNAQDTLQNACATSISDCYEALQAAIGRMAAATQPSSSGAE